MQRPDWPPVAPLSRAERSKRARQLSGGSRGGFFSRGRRGFYLAPPFALPVRSRPVASAWLARSKRLAREAMGGSGRHHVWTSWQLQNSRRRNRLTERNAGRAPGELDGDPHPGAAKHGVQMKPHCQNCRRFSACRRDPCRHAAPTTACRAVPLRAAEQAANSSETLLKETPLPTFWSGSRSG